MPLNTIAEGVWEARDRLGPFPIRMTVLKTAEGVVLWSQVPIDDALAESIDRIGEVAAIVSPNLFHYAFVNDAKARYPRARVLTTPGLETKRPGIAPDARTPDPGFAGLQVFQLAGCDRVEESVVFHAASGTLVVTDLIFNVKAATNVREWMVFRLMAGTLGRAGQSRLWRFLRTDADAHRASLDEVLALPIKQVVMAHGEPITTDAKETLVRALGLSG
ncbi:MAG: hypothetical protein AAGE52_05010 [Myxococcota bacterium]